MKHSLCLIFAVVRSRLWQPPLQLEQTNGWPLRPTMANSQWLLLGQHYHICLKYGRLAYQMLPSRSISVSVMGLH